MATRCPDCGTDVVEELNYCFGCFRHLTVQPAEKEAAGEPKRSRRRGRKNRKPAVEETVDVTDAPEDELVDAAKQTFMTWEPGAIPKGTLTFGTASQESDWGRRTLREDH